MPVLPINRAETPIRRNVRISERRVSSADVPTQPLVSPGALTVPKEAFETVAGIGAEELAPGINDVATALQEAEVREQTRNEAIALLNAKKSFRKGLLKRQTSLIATSTSLSPEDLAGFGDENTSHEEELLGSYDWSYAGRLKLLQMTDNQGAIAIGSLSAYATEVNYANTRSEVKETTKQFVDSVKKDSSMKSILNALDGAHRELAGARNILNPIDDVKVAKEVAEEIVLAGLNSAKSQGEFVRIKEMLKNSVIKASLSQTAMDKFVESLKVGDSEKTAKIKNFEYFINIMGPNYESSIEEMREHFLNGQGEGAKSLKEKVDELRKALGGKEPTEQQILKLAKAYVAPGVLSENEIRKKGLIGLGVNPDTAFLVAYGMAHAERNPDTGDWYLISDSGKNLGKIPKNEQYILQKELGDQIHETTPNTEDTYPKDKAPQGQPKQDIDSISPEENREISLEHLRQLTEELEQDPDNEELKTKLFEVQKAFIEDFRTTNINLDEGKTEDSLPPTESEATKSAPVTKSVEPNENWELVISDEDRELLKTTDLSILDAAALASGPISAVRNVISNYIGWMMDGVLFPDTSDALQIMRTFKQLAKAALINNKRFPMGEQVVVDKLLADIDKLFIDPDRVQRDMRVLKQQLQERRALMKIELDKPNTTSKLAADYRYSIGTVNQVLGMMNKKGREEEIILPEGIPQGSYVVGKRNGLIIYQDPIPNEKGEFDQWEVVDNFQEAAPSQKKPSNGKKKVTSPKVKSKGNQEDAQIKDFEDAIQIYAVGRADPNNKKLQKKGVAAFKVYEDKYNVKLTANDIQDAMKQLGLEG